MGNYARLWKLEQLKRIVQKTMNVGLSELMLQKIIYAIFFGTRGNVV